MFMSMSFINILNAYHEWQNVEKNDCRGGKILYRQRKNKVSEKMNKKEILKLAKGFRGRAKNCIRIAIERVEKALQYSYKDRRKENRDMHFFVDSTHQCWDPSTWRKLW